MLIDIYDILNKKVDELLQNKFIYPKVLEFHPVLNQCNLSCKWCVGKTDKPLKAYYMDFEKYRPFLLSAYNIDKTAEWPLEIHICGNNSEPLLNSNFVNDLCDFVKNKSIIEIITNGILLNRIIYNLIYIDKISISLDVFNSSDFHKLKGGTETQYKEIFSNIKDISIMKRMGKIKTMIYVTFVLDNAPTDYYQTYCFIEYLKKIGVNYIQFRSNYFNSRNNIEILNFVNYIKQKFSIPDTVDYTSSSPDIFFIKYNEYGNFDLHRKCYMIRFWPIFSAMNLVYPCAHVANENNMDMAFNLELENDYYKFWRELNYEKLRICKRPEMCPSIANSINGKCNLKYGLSMKK